MGQYRGKYCWDILTTAAQTFWCSKNNYASHPWAGSNVRCKPLAEEVAGMLCQATSCYHESPEDTRALLVFSDWPDARWWPNIGDSSICQCVRYHPAGTQLFTAPATGRGQCKVVGPTRWIVIMLLLGKPAVAGVCNPWGPWLAATSSQCKCTSRST